MTDRVLVFDQLPDDDPERSKQCRVCGIKWIDKQTARNCAARDRRNGLTTPNR